jgi:hypothetical protein
VSLCDEVDHASDIRLRHHATQGQAMRVIAGAQKEEVGYVHRLFRVPVY